MPFQFIETLPATPVVTVYISGLLIVRCLDLYLCEIGAIASPPHRLKITLDIKEPDNATRRVTLHSEDPVNFGITLNSASNRGLFAFKGPSSTYPAFSRHTRRDHGRDIRWAINLEGDEFHRELLEPDESKIHSKIRMNSGVFYSVERTDDSLPVKRIRGGDYGMNSITGVIGARINVDSGSHVNLTGLNESLSLPRDAVDRPGTTYEIGISNEPPEGTPTDSDELANYYPALKKRAGTPILDPEKWKLTVGDSTGLATTDEIPCMPTVLNGVGN